MNPLVTALVAMAVGLALTACSGPENAEKGVSGRQWIGEGKPGVFAVASNQCGRNVPRWQRKEVNISSSLVNKRNVGPKHGAYTQCMKNRGWVIGR